MTARTTVRIGTVDRGERGGGAQAAPVGGAQTESGPGPAGEPATAGGEGAAVRAGGASAPVAVRRRRRSVLVSTLGPLALDIGIPVGGYYLLHDGFGVGLVMSLALSSVVPALHAIVGALRERRFNGLAGLMVAVNVLSLVLSFLTGDARLMVAKDSGITGAFGLCVLGAALRGTSLMAPGMKPFLTRGRVDRTEAWDRLEASSVRFRRLQCRFSVTWGVVLMAESAVRIVGAYSLPVSTMVWMSNVIAAVGIGLGMVAGGAVATQPMELMIRSEIRGA